MDDLFAVPAVPGHQPPAGPTAFAGLRRYCISVTGRLSDGLSGAFEPLELQRRDGQSDLVGELQDQGALYGVLFQIQALGLELREVKIL